jgi:molybdopterin synthase catalytic subunit
MADAYARLKADVERLKHEVRYWKIEAEHDHERWLNVLAELDKHVKNVPRPPNEA